MLHQFRQVSSCTRQDETTTSTFPVFPKSATKKQAQFPQNGIFLLKRYKAADSTNMTPSHSPDSPMTIFIRRQKNPIYMRLHICFYRPSIRVRAQRIKIITFVPPFSLISVFVCFEQKKAVSFAPYNYIDYSTNGAVLSTSLFEVFYTHTSHTDIR